MVTEVIHRETPSIGIMDTTKEMPVTPITTRKSRTGLTLRKIWGHGQILDLAWTG